MSVYLERELSDFIREYVTSFVAWDVITFLATARGEAVSAGFLADQLGRKRQEVAEELAKLKDKQLLSQDDSGRYHLVRVKKIDEQVSKFMVGLRSRETRVAMLAMILSGQEKAP